MNLPKETAVTGVRRNKAGKVTAFNINRKVWGRGERGGFLLAVRESPESGTPAQINMCCLGIYARACGVGVKRLKNVAMPSQMEGRIPEALEVFVEHDFLGRDDSHVAFDLASINDQRNISDSDREAEITKKFAEIGIKVKFVGKG